MNKSLLQAFLFCLLVTFAPVIAAAQVSLEEYFDTKEGISADKNYVYGEGNHANLEFAETDAFQNLMTAAKSALNCGNARCFIPKDKRQSIVCKRNNKYYVLDYCKKSDIVADNDDQAYSAPEPSTVRSTASHTSSAAFSGDGVSFAFAGGEILDAAGRTQPKLAKTMEATLTQLLTEINRAHSQNDTPDLSNINIDEKAGRMFAGLWQAYPFVCNSDAYTLPALCDVRGFQIRGIDITKDEDDDQLEDNDKELCICFDNEGKITCINFSRSLNFKKLNPNVTDKRRELEILQFIENFRCYYVNKDLEALRTIFSEDAIIITGKVTMQRDNGKKDGPKFTKGVKYEVKNKEQYMKSLDNIFTRHKKIDVKFDDIKLSQHPSRENVYAVNLIQTWNSKSYQGGSYSDVGYLHLLFDFPDHGDPRIHVRAWQPLDTDKKDIITIDSYDD